MCLGRQFRCYREHYALRLCLSEVAACKARDSCFAIICTHCNQFCCGESCSEAGRVIDCDAVQVRIMKGADDAGKGGPKRPMPDVVEIIPPKDDDYVGEKGLIGKDKEGYSITKELEPVQLQPQQGLAGSGQP